MSNHLTELIQTENPTLVGETLQFLLEECSVDEMPSLEEVRQWQHILEQRGGKFQRLAQLCYNWIKEQNHATQ